MRSALVLCVLAACYHGPAPGPVAPISAKAPRVHAAPHDPLGFLPVDSELVLSIDASRLRASALWRTLEPWVSAKTGDALGKLHTQCGVDPLQSVKQIAMGFKDLEGTPGPSGVFVVYGLDRQALLACMDHLVGTDPRVTVADGVVTVTGTPSQHPAVFAFAGASTLVSVIGPTASPETLAAVIQGGAPLRRSPVFVELLGQIQTRGAAWFAINGNAKMFDKLSALNLRPKALTGSLDLASGFTGVMRMRLDSAGSAQNLAGISQARLAQVKAHVEDIELTSEDTDVVLRVVMTQAQLESLIKTLGALAAGP